MADFRGTGPPLWCMVVCALGSVVCPCAPPSPLPRSLTPTSPHTNSHSSPTYARVTRTSLPLESSAWPLVHPLPLRQSGGRCVPGSTSPSSSVIAGSVVGSVAGLCIVVALVVVLVRRRRQRRAEGPTSGDHVPLGQDAPYVQV